jgi:hypothetical protein
MNASSSTHRPFRLLAMSLLVPILATLAATAPQPARAASNATVECMLPGEIHTVGGHPTMGPRHAVQTSAEDCQQRGGEYTVATEPVAPPSTPVAAATDNTPVRCLLPKQTRQLGSKARYSSKSRVIRTTASDCQSKQGRVLASKSKGAH